jgi:hypothetical protein
VRAWQVQSPNTYDWTRKVEYLYIDFGHLGASSTDLVLGTYNWNARVTDYIACAGFSYQGGLVRPIERIAGSGASCARAWVLPAAEFHANH